MHITDRWRQGHIRSRRNQGPPPRPEVYARVSVDLVWIRQCLGKSGISINTRIFNRSWAPSIHQMCRKSVLIIGLTGPAADPADSRWLVGEKQRGHVPDLIIGQDESSGWGLLGFSLSRAKTSPLQSVPGTQILTFPVQESAATVPSAHPIRMSRLSPERDVAGLPSSWRWGSRGRGLWVIPISPRKPQVCFQLPMHNNICRQIHTWSGAELLRYRSTLGRSRLRGPPVAAAEVTAAPVGPPPPPPSFQAYSAYMWMYCCEVCVGIAERMRVSGATCR